MSNSRWMGGVLLAAGGVLLAAGVCRADFIEVRGRGVMSGKIVEQNDREITFKDNEGNATTFAREDVLYIEETGKRRSLPFKKEFQRSEGPARTNEPEGGDWVDKINVVGDTLCEKALDYFLGDSESARERYGAIIKSAQHHLKHAESFKTYSIKDKVIGGIGMVLMGAGILAVMIFNFQLFFTAFGEGFLWGIIFLANIGALFAQTFGGALGFFMLLPSFLSLFFILTHWTIVRRSVVCILFGLDLSLLGYVVFQRVA